MHRLYSFNGLVRHPLHQMLDLAVGTLPLVLAGLPGDVAVLLAFAISMQLLVQHSNIDYSLGPFKKFLAIGPVHRLHPASSVGAKSQANLAKLGCLCAKRFCNALWSTGFCKIGASAYLLVKACGPYPVMNANGTFLELRMSATG